ncbi:MAG TPA: FkbM family methyltransferase [Chitinophagales bacterium]|nr:FkbM family methyltransferase [Chitinophagales bacterium]
MYPALENVIKKIFNLFGLRVSRSWNTPVGDMDALLNDVKRRGLKVTRVLDIGAYKGWFSRQVLAVYPDALLYLVEPQQEMEPYMLGFLQQHKNARYFKMAAGAADAVKDFYIADDLACSGLMEVQSTDGKSTAVTVKAIDSLLHERQIDVPEIVKIDVQGYELEVLKGCQALFGKTELFIIETSLQKKNDSFPLMGDVIAFMDRQGYLVYDFAGFLRHKSDGSLFECDICFVKRNSFLRN